MVSDEEKFQKWLNEAMTKKSLTNRKLSELSGVHWATIGTIRNHGKSITDDNVERLTRTLNKIPNLEYPRELKGVPYKIVKGGRFRVYSNGVVYRKNTKGIIEEAPQHYSGRSRNYAHVSYSENGEQKHFSVHRLVGKAFIPNPENKPEINHIDGNPRNNDVSNLEWVTRRENVLHAYEMGLIRTLDKTPYKCIKCKGAAMNSDSLCTECKTEMWLLKGRLLSKQNQRNKFRDIDTASLKPIYRNIIKSRFRGDTLQEIGDRMGVSREYVRQLEEHVLNKNPRVYKVIKKTVKPKPILITLKAARVNADKSANEIAEGVGINVATLHNWERYKSKIPYPNFTKLCKLYNMPPENISGYRDGNWFVATYRKEQPPCNN